MYCPHCGRTLRKDESCCCCKAVAIRNGEPGFNIQRSFFRTGHPEEFNHSHNGTSLKSDIYGKYDANAYDINKYYNASKFASKPMDFGGSSSHTTYSGTSANISTPVYSKPNVPLAAQQKKKNSAGGIIFAILWIIICIILAVNGE